LNDSEKCETRNISEERENVKKVRNTNSQGGEYADLNLGILRISRSHASSGASFGLRAAWEQEGKHQGMDA
jgi:hypothetical protein